MVKKAVVLLSGGLDSTTCLAFAKNQGFECYALTFDYGQRHHFEVRAAKVIAALYQVPHRVFRLPLDEIKGSALTDPSIQVPAYEESNEVPVTYVPARNTIFLSLALAWAEVLGAWDIFIGASHVDYSNYPDCRPEYYKAFTRLADLATKGGIEGSQFQIHTPLINLSKAQTVELGLSLGVNYGYTISCYQTNEQGEACGICDSCTFRKKGFKEAGIIDPTRYHETQVFA